MVGGTSILLVIKRVNCECRDKPLWLAESLVQWRHTWAAAVAAQGGELAAAAAARVAEPGALGTAHYRGTRQVTGFRAQHAV